MPMKILMPYFILILAVGLGIASNAFANNANGFTKPLPSILSAVTVVLCMGCLSQVMKTLPVGITYASFAGLCIVGTSIVGIFKFNQIPNMAGNVGLLLIVSGVLTANLWGAPLSSVEKTVHLEQK
jgi:small multidrug resistance pump|tara:strand:+ start:40 stop:417 length:378 start_codon:yes stop_codon:yes gene_type:complete